MPGANGKIAGSGGFQQLRRRAGADAEFRAERAGAVEIGGVEDRADADNGLGHLGDDGLCRGDGCVGPQRDFQRLHPAGDQRAGQRHGVLDFLDGEDGNDDRLLEQRGQFFLLW